MQTSKVSVIIPTMKGREDLLKRLLDSLPSDCEKIVVDDEDLLLAAKRNKGARKATGEYLFFVDDDNYLKDFALSEMLKEFDETIGVMGMTGCYDDRRMIVWDGGSDRNMLAGFTKGINTNRRVFDVQEEHWWPLRHICFCYDVAEVANAFMIPRQVFEESGGFDEENFPIELDEADLCKRIKDIGYRVVVNPKAITYHKCQKTTFRRELNAYMLPRNKLLFQRKHLNALSFGVHVVFFLPLHICLYTASLIRSKQLQMIKPYLKGTLDGLFGRRENKYQQKS